MYKQFIILMLSFSFFTCGVQEKNKPQSTQTSIVIDSMPTLRPFPSATPATPPPTLTPSATMTPRQIPLRRSEVKERKDDQGEALYRLTFEDEMFGQAVAESLNEDEMMCVHPFDPQTEGWEARCTCWVGPLEDAGIKGGGLYGVRRIVILKGSVEEASLALMEAWADDIRANSDRRPCSLEQVIISYDGGLFRPQP